MKSFKNKISKLSKNQIIELIDFCNKLINDNVILKEATKVDFYNKSISFTELTEIPYSQNFNFTKCEDEIQELFGISVEWANFDDAGYLVVSFRNSIFEGKAFVYQTHSHYYHKSIAIINSCF